MADFSKLAGIVSKFNDGFIETRIHRVRETKLSLTGSSVTCIGLIPAGCILIGVAAHVDTTVTGASGIDVGDGVTQARWANNISVVQDSVSDLRDTTDTSPPIFVSSQDVVLTALTSDFTGGQITVEVHYISLLSV